MVEPLACARLVCAAALLGVSARVPVVSASPDRVHVVEGSDYSSMAPLRAPRIPGTADSLRLINSSYRPPFQHNSMS